MLAYSAYKGYKNHKEKKAREHENENGEEGAVTATTAQGTIADDRVPPQTYYRDNNGEVGDFIIIIDRDNGFFV